jgi:transcriptional regulator with GAF, ATPase, and Fis domain
VILAGKTEARAPIEGLFAAKSPLQRDEFEGGAKSSRNVEVFSVSKVQSFGDKASESCETREALEQQTATAEVLQVINSSPGDLAPVFDAILEKAHTLCGASHGALVTYDGEYFRAVATHELPAPFADLLQQPFRPEPASPQAQLLRGEHLVHMPDASALHGPGWDGPRTRAAREAGLRALLMLPLRKDSRLLGYITANRHEPGPFTEKQIALLQNFAEQAVIAMENARLLTETREALEQQTATAAVLQVINSSPGNLVPVFDAILEKAHSLCGAPYASLQLYDGERFRAVALRGLSEPMSARPGSDSSPINSCRSAAFSSDTYGRDPGIH